MILCSVKSFVKSTELIRGHGSVITKEYMEDTKVFADVFNHMTYQGEKVIDPKNLEELAHFTSNFREVMQFIKYSEDAEKLEQALTEKYPSCDVEVYAGGQPIYYYVVSVE